MWKDALASLLLLPRAQQLEACRQLQNTSALSDSEAWNTDFGSESLYEAWTRLPFMQALYRHNREVLHAHMEQRQGWHFVEIGGGNGALWRDLFSPSTQGTLTLIDPASQVHEMVAAVLPPGVQLRSCQMPIEQADIPEADAVVCSLTLHHVAGIDAQQRREFGLQGPGKLEILQRCVQALQPRQGIGLLNEADIYNEIDLAPGDAVLVDHFIDVYVRRAALAIAFALGQSPADGSLAQRWSVILENWCLAEIDNAFFPREKRDVYELDVPHWLHLLEHAGAKVLSHRYTDEWNLFHQYVFTRH